MNKNITRPLIIQFTKPEQTPALRRSEKSVFVPVNTAWTEFRDKILPMIADRAYDSVLVHVMNDVDRDTKGVVGNMSVKLNALAGAGTRAGKPVLTYETPDKPFYLANPTKTDMKAAPVYAPSDDDILAKYNSFGTDDAWQEHQGKVWARMKDMMPLSTKADEWNRDHAKQLKDPKRGFKDEDLDKFWSFKSKQGLSPTVMGDDMVGMPSVECREYEGFTMSNTQSDGTVKTKNLDVRSLMTTGNNGIMIPMANANGHVSKHQVAADLTPYSVALHFRAADGKTVAKGELFDSKTRKYSFKFADGTDTHLKAVNVDKDEVITMQDAHGIFNIKPKAQVIDVLKDRGYVIPDIITSVKPEQNGKYVWQAPGSMTGSEAVLKTVSPSKPGFIKAREPKNGEESYVVLVAEGALKGHIVAKYIDVKDSEGMCFGDFIAGNKGIIVTQVPGVAEAYLKNALSIYDRYPVAGTYIAMDADGRENRNVAIGIHSAYKCISTKCPATVLSWDPAQKGMDDALLAVAQGKTTIAEMGIISGSPDALFPIDKAEKMTPYKLDGTQTNTPSWVQEYGEDKKIREEKRAAAQAATAARQEQRAGEQMESQKEGQWMDTPQDIGSLKNVTITKAADMADAMAGRLPEQKPETRLAPTPDVDEAAAGKAGDEENIRKVSALNEDGRAEAWDAAHPAMQPIIVPDGYKASYTYQQPIVPTGNAVPELPSDSQYEGHPSGSWGIVNVTIDHELTVTEKGERQDSLRDQGAACIGNMRLTSQLFTLDPGSLTLSDDDVTIKDGGQAR